MVSNGFHCSYYDQITAYCVVYVENLVEEEGNVREARRKFWPWGGTNVLVGGD